MSSEEYARKLAEAYSPYVKIDNQSLMEKLEESIEETITRLEELDNGIKMLQAERERVGVCDLTAARRGLSTLCQKQKHSLSNHRLATYSWPGVKVTEGDGLDKILTSDKQDLKTVKVHKLDELSKRVLHDVEALEPVVDHAEAALTTSAEGRLRTMLKPLLFMKSETSSPSQGSGTSQFSPVEHFKTASIFQKEVEEEAEASQ